jgi:hypothetical protein
MSRKLGAGEEEQRAMGGSGTKRLLAMWMPAGLALGLGLGSGPGQALPAASAGDGRRLERRSCELDRQIRTREQLLLPEAEPLARGALTSPSLTAADTAPLPPLALALPEAGSLGEGQPQAPSLERTLAIGLTNSPTLQARREEVAAGLRLRYELLDFARTPKARSALANLRSGRLAYADALRHLPLSLSEAPYQLQRADQDVLRRQLAALHNRPPQLPHTKPP